ncbi:pyridoxal phosphate-dependent transferase [Schizophyllum amplum]|uniref:Pyridoxal phosphate-dependent transferase n=1 Tax=Schizophyllum amplum TaxID=97359 RepID=A0A550CSX0_9AGAR|nr:pyridoxal phosphate-dependent transferase [Auriculariopsis ampla]
MQLTDSHELVLKNVPEFGHQSRSLFQLDPSFVHLNNGSFGVIPHFVEEATQRMAHVGETNPDLFMRTGRFWRSIDASREAIAKYVGADTDTCVFVPNTATGVNTILRSISWSAEDILVRSDICFDTVIRAVESLAQFKTAPRTAMLKLGLPATHATILENFRVQLKQWRAAMPEHAKLVIIIDSIASTPAVLLPWREMVKICKEEGAWSLVDAAHSLGQEKLELKKIDADFFVANCSKWFYAKRGSALMQIPFRHQEMMQPLIPAMVNDGPGHQIHPNKFVTQFYWNGLADWLAYMSIVPALNFRRQIGGDEKINTYCHALAVKGGLRVAEILGTEVLDSPKGDGELVANMANVRLPIDTSIPGPKVFQLFHTETLGTYRTYAVPYMFNGSWWVRACAQVYAEMADFERLGHVLVEVCRKINSTANDSHIVAFP